MNSLRSQIPLSFFETNILDSSLPEHVNYILQEAGFNTLAELTIKMLQTPDDILRLNGIGPKAMKSIQDLMESLPDLRAAELEDTQIEPLEERNVDQIAEIESKLETSEVKAETEPDTKTELESALVTEEFSPDFEKIDADLPVDEDLAEEPEEELATVPEEEGSFDELFALEATNLDIPFVEEDEEELPDDKKAKKKKDKKKKRHVQVEYDDEEDVLIYRKQHKRTKDLDWEL